MARDEKLDLLRRIPLFGRLGTREIERLGQLTDEIDLPAGRSLMRQGEAGAELFVIVAGSATVERDGGIVAKSCGPGEILGEIALVDGGPRTASVTLDEPSRLLVLSRNAFLSVMEEFPSVREAVLQTLAERVRGLDRDAYN